MTQRNQLHCHEEILSVSRQLPRAFLFTNILRAPLVSGEVATGKIQSSDRATELCIPNTSSGDDFGF
jgi:hypothetical protein